MVFIDVNMYILIEGRNFKTFLKENYATAWDSCYLFTKMLNLTILVCNIRFICFYGGSKLFISLDGSRILGSIEAK